jgi:Flp pilus assembly protein CpaB
MRRRRIIRSTWVYWLAVAALAAFTGLVVARLVGDAQAASARFGVQRDVVVASRAVEAGRMLATSDVSVRRMPAAFVPSGALTSARSAAGRAVVVPLFPGEVVLRAHVAPDGLRGLAARLHADERAVAVPAGVADPPVREGDLVDVLATSDGFETNAITVGARVLATDTDATTLAVSADAAIDIAGAVARGAVTLAVRSPIAPRTP